MIRVNLFILFFICLQGFVFSQDRLVLTLEEAKQHALEYNKSHLNARLEIEKAQMGLREAIAAGLPQVSAAMDYSNALGAVISIRFAEEMPPTEIPIKPQSNFNLNVGQLLFSGNYIVGVQMANLYKELSEKSFEKSELEVVTQVSDGYYLVLVSGELLKIMSQNLENLNELYDKTAALEEAGIIEQIDLDQLSVQVNSLENAVRSSERQFELAKNMLRLQLGVTADTKLELTDSLESLLNEAEFEATLLKDFDPEENIDYQLMQHQVMLSEKMVDMKKANYLPTLSAFYSYTYKILKPDFDMAPPHVVGLQMNIPIFSGGDRNAQVKQAEIDLKTMQNNRALLTDQLKMQEKQLRFNYANTLETYFNQKKNVEVSRRVYDNLKQKYSQGIISGLDLQTADNNYLRAETEYISAIMQVLSARVQLERLYGSVTN